MMCLLIQEFEAIQAGIDLTRHKIYLNYGPSSGTLHNGTYHPNRCVYIIPETNPFYSWYIMKGIGKNHNFDPTVLEKNGWL